MMTFEQFILEHDGQDTAALALAADRLSGQVKDFHLALSTLQARRTLKGKVPEWYAVASLEYPFKLSAEQCSSSSTARYKADIAQRLGAARIADLTGGMGVDSWAFSRKAAKVLYNEMNPTLAECTGRNLQKLGIQNITIRSKEAGPGCISEILDGFQPELIYMDPARRGEGGRKVFLLEDCSPDVTRLLPELFSVCPTIMLKLSPMADITAVSRALGFVKEIHCVASEGECKELLFVLQKGYSGEPDIFMAEDGAAMTIGNPGPAEYATPLPGNFLFVPGKAMMKAGAYTLPCSYGLSAMGKNVHLYSGSARAKELEPFGKYFIIKEILPFNKRSFSETASRYPRADVSVRNLPVRAEALQKRLGVKPGGGYHIFAAGGAERVLIIALATEREAPVPPSSARTCE